MITELDAVKQQVETIEGGIQLCEQAIAKAEKYEILEAIPAWKEFWKDLDPIIEKHRRDIEMACASLVDAPNYPYVKKDGVVVQAKADWVDFIAQHEIQIDHLLQWKKEPERLLRLAALSRENLPGFRKKLAELRKNVPTETES